MQKTITVIWDGVTKIAFEKTKAKAKEEDLRRIEGENRRLHKADKNMKARGFDTGRKSTRRFLDEAEEAQLAWSVE